MIIKNKILTEIKNENSGLLSYLRDVSKISKNRSGRGTYVRVEYPFLSAYDLSDFGHVLNRNAMILPVDTHDLVEALLDEHQKNMLNEIKQICDKTGYTLDKCFIDCEIACWRSSAGFEVFFVVGEYDCGDGNWVIRHTSAPYSVEDGIYHLSSNVVWLNLAEFIEEENDAIKSREENKELLSLLKTLMLKANYDLGLKGYIHGFDGNPQSMSRPGMSLDTVHKISWKGNGYIISRKDLGRLIKGIYEDLKLHGVKLPAIS